MLTAARDLLKRELSPEVFRRVTTCWWYSSFYLPRSVASSVIRRSPKVYGRPSGLVTRLSGINCYAPTQMCRIMTKYGSDKGRHWHNYTTVYSELFGKLRDRPLRIFELGLGTIKQDLPSHMAELGRPGASLRGWREIFPHAQVFGADIDRDTLFAEDRIQTFYCDQLDENVIRGLWAQPDLRDEMEIIIDDGLHTFEANVSFLAGSLEHLRAGGIYVVEDIDRDAFEKWKEQLPGYQSRFPDHDFALAALPNDFNDSDNNLLIIAKQY
jgi:SAM-dependent methyltransferase